MRLRPSDGSPRVRATHPRITDQQQPKRGTSTSVPRSDAQPIHWHINAGEQYGQIRSGCGNAWGARLFCCRPVGLKLNLDLAGEGTTVTGKFLSYSTGTAAASAGMIRGRRWPAPTAAASQGIRECQWQPRRPREATTLFLPMLREPGASSATPSAATLAARLLCR